MEHISSTQNARSIQTFDFSTLYTKIPLEELKDKLKKNVEKAFKGGNNQYIRVTQQDVGWCHQKKTNTFSKDEVFAMIDLVVDNSFFRFGDRVYRQCIGIPMGIDPAPQMANLYLYYYESSFMETITKENYGIPKKFNNTSRFIDDLATLNNDRYLQQFKERIYPKELVLNQENKEDNRATFLDFEAHIKDGKFCTKTYDKREAFNFKIVNYPDLSGNIPERPAYGIYISQVIRYAKICNQTKDFIDRIRLLFNKLRKKHFSKERLLAALKKCCRKNPRIMDKHHHGMNNHLANDCWGADTWSWYRDSSPETSVSVHGWRHPTTSIKSISHHQY